MAEVIRWGVLGPGEIAHKFELVSVRTPHIEGVVEYYQLKGNRLEIVAARPGYSSHRIGSRNLDTALAGDFTATGRIDLLLPDQNFKKLALLRRHGETVQELHSLAVGGTISTNLAATTTPEGIILLGVGRLDAILRVWLPVL